jgi:Zn-finger nucleic acid-binding protein
MAEIDLKGIKVDRCGSCEGVYFDQGELDLLLQAQEPHGFLANMRRVFKA